MSSLSQVAAAFAVVAKVIRVFQVGGRRVQRFELERNAKFIEYNKLSPMLTAHMAPRKARRAMAKAARKPFRPVYGFVGPVGRPFEQAWGG